MKKFRKVLAALGAVAMLGLGVFTSCGGDDGDDDVSVSALTLAKSDGTEIGESIPQKSQAAEKSQSRRQRLRTRTAP